MANPYKDGERVILHGLIYIYRRRPKALFYEGRATSKIEIAPLIIHFRYQDCWESGDRKYKRPEDVVSPPIPQKTNKADKFIADVKNGAYANRVFALRALGRASGHGAFPDSHERNRVRAFIDQYFIGKPSYTPAPKKRRGLQALFNSATALKAQLAELKEMKELLNSMDLEVEKK